MRERLVAGAGSALRVARSRAFRIVFAAALVAAVAAVLVTDGPRMASAAAQLPLAALVVCALGVVVNVAAAGLAWRCLLAAWGHRLPVRAAARVFCVGQLGKYLPGGIWNVATQAELAADHGVPRLLTAGASAVQLGLSVAVAGVLSVPALLFLTVPAVPAWAVLVAVPLLALFHPGLLNPLLDRAFALLGRPVPPHLTTGGLVVALAWTLISWAGLALHVAALVVGLGAPRDATTLLVVCCGYAAAWLVGFVVLFAPAGAGAREVALIGILLAVVSRPEAVVVTLTARLVGTAVDLLAALAGLAWARGLRARPAPGAPADR